MVPVSYPDDPVSLVLVFPFAPPLWFLTEENAAERDEQPNHDGWPGSTGGAGRRAEQKRHVGL